ncbi:MAG: hypothetical protein QOI57_3022 [Rubrobacteraceae bacterium]|jgi:hypothetical protein|nr:hypothetical protein [Rubrobacteraceae bacterium]
MNRAEGSEYPLFQKLTPRLEDVLEYWTARGTTFKKHGGAIYGDHCPKCYPEHSLVRTVLPSPREALVRQLGKAGLLTLDRLIELCNDQRDDVKQAAARLAATKAAEENTISDLLARVDPGELPDHILCEIVALPTDTESGYTVAQRLRHTASASLMHFPLVFKTVSDQADSV